MNGWNSNPEAWRDEQYRNYLDGLDYEESCGDEIQCAMCLEHREEVTYLCEDKTFKAVYCCNECIEEHAQEHDLTHEQAIEHIKTNINSKSKNHGFIRNYRGDIQPGKQSFHRSAS